MTGGTPEADQAMGARAAGPANPAVAAPRALVVGYGNSLRSDDGVGWHAAMRAADDPRFAGVAVLAVHQLTPELALDLSRVDVAVFIDAAMSLATGFVVMHELTSGGAGSTASTSSHHVDAGTLLAMARQLYGAAPLAWSVEVGIASMEPGEALTPAVEAALPEVLAAAAEAIGRRR